MLYAAIISISLAVIVLFGYHALCIWKEAREEESIGKEIERLRTELDYALENGYVGAAARIKRRLQELLDK